jgi:hypothetical protein
MDAGRQARLTPPPDQSSQLGFTIPAHNQGIESIEKNVFTTNAPFNSASTPPSSDSNSSSASADGRASTLFGDVTSSITNHGLSAITEEHNVTMEERTHQEVEPVFEDQFDALINFDNEAFGNGEHDWGNVMHDNMHGESGGFMVDMDWMKDAGTREVQAGFGAWTAGSPVLQDGQVQQNGQSEQTTEEDMHMDVDMQLAPEEKAVLLLKEQEFAAPAASAEVA